MAAPNQTQYRFCPICGSLLKKKLVEGKKRLICAKCGFIFWKNPTPAVSIILPKEGGVLLLQRSQEPAKGYWVLPGGYVEYDEDPQTTIIREVKEETGLNIVVQRIIWTYLIDTDPRGNSVDIVFLGDIIGGTLQLKEHHQYRFFSPANLPGLIAYKHKEAIEIWHKQS